MKTLRRQRGAVLIVMVTVLVLGFAWFASGVLGKVAVSTADREAKTALALQAAKKALLGYVAQYAGRTNFDFPGRMPCPESLSAYGTATEGQAPGACSNTAVVVGRLPWQTLGIDQLRDADGEPLWYVLSPNFHPTSFPLNAAPPNPFLNFGTPPALPFDGSNVVAVIIAPGRALRSNPCNAVNQQTNRFATPLDPTKFFECGNATGAYTNPGSNAGSNDRVLAITATEWADAVAGPVADRLQRQIAPKLANWDQRESVAQGKSWGATYGLGYLPFASTFGDPTVNDYCGNVNVREGLLPLAGWSAAACDTRWNGSGASLSGLLPAPCVQEDAQQRLRCPFIRLIGALLPATVTATAPVGTNFRGTIACPLPYSVATCDIGTSGGTVTAFNMAMSNTGTATLTVSVQFPALPLFASADVLIPYAPNAQVLADLPVDADSQWFKNNMWERYTYYAVAPGATPVAAVPCNGPGASCLTVNGLPASTGSLNDKKFVLVLSGRPLAGQVQPSAVPTNYVEGENANMDQVFVAAAPSSTLNDLIATCPFQQTSGAGAAVPICP